MKPGVSFDTVTTLPHRTANSLARFNVSWDVWSAAMSSTRDIIGTLINQSINMSLTSLLWQVSWNMNSTGLKKWRPTTREGEGSGVADCGVLLLVGLIAEAAIFVSEMEDVFDARMAPGLQIDASWEKMACLSGNFSATALIPKIIHKKKYGWAVCCVGNMNLYRMLILPRLPGPRLSTRSSLRWP